MIFKATSLTTTDTEIINNLKAGYAERTRQEKKLYEEYFYFVNEGCRKYNLTHEDSFSAYSDAFLSAVLNIVSSRFDGRSSIKTYLFQIFSNKCIDLIRKSTTNKQQVFKTAEMPELMNQLPDAARTAVEKMVNHEQRIALKETMEKIGERCKELLLLFEDGYTDKEIAQHLNYNNAAVVKTTRLRCLDKLREKIKTHAVSQ